MLLLTLALLSALLRFRLPAASSGDPKPPPPPLPPPPGRFHVERLEAKREVKKLARNTPGPGVEPRP